MPHELIDRAEHEEQLQRRSPQGREQGRRVTETFFAELAPLGITSRRESIEGKKHMAYPVTALREAIQRHHHQ
ncbi:MAG: hypothetical protein ACRDRP_07740 [Pseudonocardiaceae bacterium]